MMILDLQFFDFKIDSNGTQVISMELIFTISHEQAGFTNSTISNDEKFNTMIFSVIHVTIRNYFQITI